MASLTTPAPVAGDPRPVRRPRDGGRTVPVWLAVVATSLPMFMATLDNLVMTTTYITDRSYREGYNEVRRGLYKKDPPTSTLLIVSGLANEDYMIEIAGIAVL